MRESETALELRHLRYIIAAADHGSFRRAAVALNVRESAISRRIRDVEDHIGVALFVRNHSGVRLTQGGARFLSRARRALGHIGYAASDAASFGRGENGVVRIGIFTSLSSGFLANLLRLFVSSHPDVKPELVEGGPSEHVAAILCGEMDVAFLKGDPPASGCDNVHLWNERVFVALPAGDDLASRLELNWSDLQTRHFIVSEVAPGPEVHDYLVKHLGDLGRRPSVEEHSVGRDNLLNLVAMKQGLTLTTEATIAASFPGVVYRPLADAILPFRAIWFQRSDNPALRRLLSMAKAMSRKVLANGEKSFETGGECAAEKQCPDAQVVAAKSVTETLPVRTQISKGL